MKRFERATWFCILLSVRHEMMICKSLELLIFNEHSWFSFQNCFECETIFWVFIESLKRNSSLFIFICLFARRNYRETWGREQGSLGWERKTKRKRMNLPFSGLPPNDHKSQDWMRLNPGARGCIQVSFVGMEAHMLLDQQCKPCNNWI